MNAPDPKRIDLSSGLPPDHVDALNDRKRELQSELARVRREAHAARLEANAARLEATASQIESELQSLESSDRAASGSETPGFSPAKLQHPAAQRFASWGEVREALETFTKVATRRDAAHGPMVRAPKLRRLADPDARTKEFTEPTDDNAFKEDTQVDTADLDSSNTDDVDVSAAFDDKAPADSASTVNLPGVVTSDEETDTAGRRRRPAAVIISAVVHAVLILALGLFTLSTTRPKDQMAFAASTASESEESSFETFAIESSEPITEPTETQPEETQYDVSEIGEMAIVDITSTAVNPVDSSVSKLSSLASSNSATSQAMQKLSSDAKSQMEFCGVEGGGNHFVYLVDSSGSMGDAFKSARTALLQSIDMLGEKQRFYVVFFDAECDYMTLSGAEPESRSVYATAQNKQSIRNWAMRVSMDRGKAPYEPLRFALELKPDVIFLLSDGEFPQGIEDLLNEENRVTNLFGESNPISIIHTISYHSREGESRMRRIAEKNFGQYRHVPKP
ncbi:hypothetical protein [Rhodopirellula halodulae]|uniref:hypothetical protein n=1 Tax=Rhodopirellula halodulae TaxID=2894198 RepID=UPI001E445078|nr:hypothetical protein [Rhodopirellula sp. JC737]MCC9656936.1 hypothetical protein [Rhodopirellula sp. JC737]